MSRSLFCPSSSSAIQLGARAWHASLLPSAWVSSVTIWLSSRCWNRRITRSAGRTLTCPCPTVKSSYHDYLAYLLCLFFCFYAHCGKIFSFSSASLLTTSLPFTENKSYDTSFANSCCFSNYTLPCPNLNQHFCQDGENLTPSFSAGMYLLTCLRLLAYCIGKFSHWLAYFPSRCLSGLVLLFYRALAFYCFRLPTTPNGRSLPSSGTLGTLPMGIINTGALQKRFRITSGTARFALNSWKSNEGLKRSRLLSIILLFSEW